MRRGEVVEGATGGAPCLFLQGASGELAPRGISTSATLKSLIVTAANWATPLLPRCRDAARRQAPRDEPAR